MKAWIVNAQKPIEEKPLEFVENYPVPEPREKEIRVRVTHCGICRTDLHIAEGDIPLSKKPVIPGHEIVGFVDKLGENAKRFKIGDRVGISWLNSTCGKCKYCQRGDENYCPDIKRTGYDVDGGFAEYVLVHEDYAFDLRNVSLPSEELAPIMCPGITGHYAFRISGIRKGERLGMLGFGPTAYYILRVAKSMNIEVYISTRSEEHKRTAMKYGADWVGNIAHEDFPNKVDAFIFFPTAGKLVERALANTLPSATLVLGAVTMSPIIIENYTANLWGRTIKTIYQVRRDYGREFIEIADRLKLGIEKEIVKFSEIPEAMLRLKKGEINGMVQVIEIGKI
ncbi:alcohol dehydrogenase catalytic domain-containing protein [Candidatus Aciduliprofundum boonei]|uniref:Alcohol dehydrogenase GroES domain protein n=1 Tax=Aciduliprofundum boonei (strain DSM 19572 / T469) TaxID=439481 RepID=B5IDT3_ACIB4|nr:alcohol dehydrogenase catalytic domain-containing protein [Candidatus Aciduliprofundum boonei]ADD08163.1 Alcohol dehydrogenase GroES domain protein [Aciduliprofundum boonei T469]EDY35606.1 Alcohol dehydrogenase GroES-like domain family [Aciduliprofundum boonei T469]HII54538.1 alcohol dehydrogenase catalytic domain-containing protein [Candidatus Aciduliprofundum boonei]